MMKKYFDGVIVVEGTSDSAFLSSFIESIYVETNGFEIPKEEINFLKNLPSNKRVIILTDSDEAGMEIRTRLLKELVNPINAIVDINLCNKNNKHGVAECSKNEVINVLEEHLQETNPFNNKITTSDIVALGINTKEKRKTLCQNLNLGICNNKTMIKRMNFLNIQIEEIKKAMKEDNGD